jgi:hypothetical protein
MRFEPKPFFRALGLFVHSTSTCMDYVYYVTYVTYVTSSGDTGGSHAQIFA